MSVNPSYRRFQHTLILAINIAWAIYFLVFTLSMMVTSDGKHPLIQMFMSSFIVSLVSLYAQVKRINVAWTLALATAILA